MTVTFRPRIICFFLSACVVFLTVMGVAVMANWEILRFRNPMTMILRDLFSLATDESIPTWYASLSLLFASLLLAIIAVHAKLHGERFRHHWSLLSLTFLLLSIDEVARIHERVGPLFGSFVKSDWNGFLAYSWVVGGMLFVLLFVLANLMFLLSLQKRFRLLLVASGVLFVSGAIGVEMLNARQYKLHGTGNMTYALGTALEELLEMAGILLFIYTLSLYIVTNVGRVALVVTAHSQPSGIFHEAINEGAR